MRIDAQEALTIMRLLDMDRPLCELMPHVPKALLDEITVAEDVAATFGMFYQNQSPTVPLPVERLAQWRRNVQKVASYEQLRRKGWIIKAWPRDFADDRFWNEVRAYPQRQTIELKAA